MAEDHGTKWFAGGLVGKQPPGPDTSTEWRGDADPPRERNTAPGASRRWTEDGSPGGGTHPTRERSSHPLVRPEWLCRTCGIPWPCPPARDELSAAFGRDRVALAVAMSIELQRAAGELPRHQYNAGDLYHRFIGWTR